MHRYIMPEDTEYTINQIFERWREYRIKESTNMDSVQLTKAIAALNVKLSRQVQAVEATRAQIEAFTELQTRSPKPR